MSPYDGALAKTPDHTASQVCSSELGRAGIDRFSRGLSTGCHKKAPVRCPRSRLAALHGCHRACNSCEFYVSFYAVFA